MNSRTSAALLVALILVVTLTPKFLTAGAPVDAQAEAQAKVVALKAFLVANGVTNPKLINPNRNSHNWVGWSISEPGCAADAFADIGSGDVLELLRGIRTTRTKTAFIYRGEVLDNYPRFWVARDKALARIEHVVRRPRWEKPLVIDLFYSGDCRSILKWDWSRLWPD